MKVKLEDEDLHLVINPVPDNILGFDVFEISIEEYEKYKAVHQWLRELLDRYLIRLERNERS